MTSEAQIQANRRNAEHSTGPKSDTGKCASARNAMKHGAYATSAVAIPRGFFAEDEAEIREYLDSLIADLHPRDGLELEMATRVAVLLLRLRRTSRLESETVAGDTTKRRGIADYVDPLISGDDELEMRRERAALQAIENSMNLVSVIDARTATALEKALKQYAVLQQRALPNAEEQ